MPSYICETCGTSYPPSGSPPERCPICDDERQFVRPSGQRWTTLDELRVKRRNAWRRLETDLFEIQTVPEFAIGQRALLVRTPDGNILWDCVTLLDDATVGLVSALGGLSAIAISHPHYYSTCQDWAHAFGCPVYLHAADRAWQMRPDPAVRLWEGSSLPLGRAATLIVLGGHFDGATALHWPAGGEGGGALLSGDLPQVTAGADRVSFMWSYPNYMPLSPRKVSAIAGLLATWRFERIYGAFPGRNVLADGNAIVARSAKRYIELLDDR